MARWQPDARSRLSQAAVELYAERGFDRTTVAEIAERAGLTERTFFRHFADKREVLFSGEADARVLEALEDAPASATPMQAIERALEAAGPLFAERRDTARRRRAVIAAHPSLQERELLKLARLASDMTGVLERRGAPAPVARAAAETGAAIFRLAFERWLDDGERDFAELVAEVGAEFRSAVG
jgi:AcrR family transcriptional regulator